ncbi:HGL088Wp [Eremothecium sinecaudum]|uniref:HGL088Wp n=1 Tax=Eremothecium sinecaudum TaxID=45286 RepID=A0A0X8HVF3_9SACH|nr:HGL088Wp [Eremothecium sinecaudum]AMD22252.1 HGL088Wp [Eremothecium sinecaudum]
MMAKDLRHLLSKEALIRKPSPIKTTMAYFEDPKMVFLGAGMPPGELFPINSITIDAPLPPTANPADYDKSGIVLGKILKVLSDREFLSDIPLERALQYGNSRGQKELLDFLKQHMLEFHRVLYEDWDIITTAGATQAWDATLRVFCDPDDSILLEELTYSSSVEAAESQLLYCVGMEMDEDGIIPEKLAYLLENWNELHPGRRFPKLLYTIPTGQNPTGATLSEDRKPIIYALANRYDMMIIEDDPYYYLNMGEYVPGLIRTDEMYNTTTQFFIENPKQFKKSLSKSFLELDFDGRVIRLDSMTKIFAPGCRTGWIMGPKYLLDIYWNLHELSIQSTSGFSQSIINGILCRWGHERYKNWLIQLCQLYTKKRDFCLDCCYKYLPLDFVRVPAPMAGMFFMVYFDALRHPLFETKFESDPNQVEEYLYKRFVEEGVLLACGSWFKVNRNSRKNTEISFRGTFAAPQPAALELGIRTAAKVIRTEFKL